MTKKSEHEFADRFYDELRKDHKKDRTVIIRMSDDMQQTLANIAKDENTNIAVVIRTLLRIGLYDIYDKIVI